MSKAEKEIMYMIQLLVSIKMLVKLQVMVGVDNVGAIFMASIINTMSCKMFMDIG